MRLKNSIIKWSGGLLLASFLLPSHLSAQETIQERQQRAKKVELFYNMAEEAYENGEYDAAREALRSALALNRQHAHSIALTRKMQASGGRNVVAIRKRNFDNVIVPTVDYDAISFQDAITILAETVEKQSNGKVIPNFVINDREGILKNAEITLKLKSVPAGNVLEHLLKSAGASARFGKYTTTIRPRNSSQGNSSTPKRNQIEE